MRGILPGNTDHVFQRVVVMELKHQLENGIFRTWIQCANKIAQSKVVQIAVVLPNSGINCMNQQRSVAMTSFNGYQFLFVCHTLPIPLSLGVGFGMSVTNQKSA